MDLCGFSTQLACDVLDMCTHLFNAGAHVLSLAPLPTTTVSPTGAAGTAAQSAGPRSDTADPDTRLAMAVGALEGSGYARVGAGGNFDAVLKGTLSRCVRFIAILRMFGAVAFSFRRRSSAFAGSCPA